MKFTPLLLACVLSHFEYVNADYYQRLQICERGLVQVSSISVVCNTPLTWSYTRGSHRNSATCDYGDYANITVNFDVVDDYGSEIYVNMKAFSDQSEQIYQSSSTDLCGTFVGTNCSSKGSYSFVRSIQFASISGNSSGFVPLVTMAFSSLKYGGTDLGGANVKYCPGDDDDDNDTNSYTEDVYTEDGYEEVESTNYDNDSFSSQQSGGAVQQIGPLNLTEFIVLTTLFAVAFVIALGVFIFLYKRRAATKKVPAEFKEALMEKGQAPGSNKDSIKLVDIVPDHVNKSSANLDGEGTEIRSPALNRAVSDRSSGLLDPPSKRKGKLSANVSKAFADEENNVIMDNVELSRRTLSENEVVVEKKTSDSSYSM